jgi:hypothetical protein
VDRLERATVDPVEPLASLVADLDRSDRSEHAQVLGHLRLGQPQLADQVVHGPLPAGKDIEDLPPPGLGNRVEHIGGRRRSCHGPIIYSYEHMHVQPGSGRGGELAAQAVSIRVAPSRPSSATEASRILNFCTLPVTVMGKASTKRQ